jgi:RNA polymerase sigma factor (sigma-70 family)
MARDSEIPPESFEAILAWLNPDRDVAATMYLQLRKGLERMFAFARCDDVEGLTDEVVDRVAKKVDTLRESYHGDPRAYFHAVARNVIKEQLKKVKSHASLEGIDAATRVPEIEEETAAMREECLQSCLRQLSPKSRDIILNYYAKEKQAKIDHRAALADRLDTSVETLRVRAFRIRQSLVKCIERCLDLKAQKK